MPPAHNYECCGKTLPRERRRYKAVITVAMRWLCLFFLRITGKLDSLLERANFTAIGFTGYVSLPDERLARERQLKPLNWFERWLLKPCIQAEQVRRRAAFREAVIEVTGEDPETDWV